MQCRNRFTLNVCSSKLCTSSTAVIRCFKCSWSCTKYHIYYNPHVCISVFQFVLFASVIILFVILLLFWGGGWGWGGGGAGL